ncbi:GPW/gp25 family protein [uncultured Shewanella sp.]|uniref:GPW/gp25 family protein n=1 Tax=uncultured Shewanella sp. TaxID=173975 RepID=UPI002601ECF1|nr:GPW/gp25 family protein [uncultured Shewanella sp.]
MNSTGWEFPPIFKNLGSAIGMSSGGEKIKQSLKVIFSTHLGERLKHADFGCNLAQFNFEPITNQFVSVLEDEITNAIKKHEPRIHQFNLALSHSADTPETINIRVKYWLDGSDEEQVFTYPLALENI